MKRFILPVKQTRAFLSSTTARLAESYLLIIMLMSIGFSLVLYNTSANQLGHQIPPHGLTQQASPNNDQGKPQDDNPALDHFFHQRIAEGRTALRFRLLYLNVGALLVGAVVSYYLARRSLRPIEQAMDAQVQFVSDASHELRTPLTAIKAVNEVALRNKKLSLSNAKNVITQNIDDVERLQALAEGLLMLAKQDKTKLTYSAVALQTIVGDAMTQIIPQASNKAITVNDEVANISVIGNKAALEQVLVILLDNAVAYSHPKTTITLQTRIKGKHVYLDIVDQGIGIRATDLPHIFSRFYRGDQSRSASEKTGYGLGLSIAQRIMLNHDGAITVHSVPGEGSTFTLKLSSAG